MLSLESASKVVALEAEQVSQRIRAALPVTEAHGGLDISTIETFTHTGNHGQTGTYALDVELLSTLRRVADDAAAYKKVLDAFAPDTKTLADHIRKGSDVRRLAPDWLNEPSQGFTGGNVYDSLPQQREWIRNDWQSRCTTCKNFQDELSRLRTRAGIGSLGRLVGVLAAFLAFGVVAPLAYLSARGGSSRTFLLVTFAVLSVFFLAYLANEVRRSANALHLEREFW